MESYLLNTKESLEIFPYFSNFIKRHRIPKYIITHNGKEFENNLFKNFCDNNNISFYIDNPIDPILKELLRESIELLKRDYFVIK